MSDNTVCFANQSDFARPLYILRVYYCVKTGSPEKSKCFILDNEMKISSAILALKRISIKSSTYNVYK